MQKILFALIVATFCLQVQATPKKKGYFLDKWIAGKKVELTVEGKKQSMQIFKRYMVAQKKYWSVADILLNKIPKEKGEGYVNPDKFMNKMDMGMV